MCILQCIVFSSTSKILAALRLNNSSMQNVSFEIFLCVGNSNAMITKKNRKLFGTSNETNGWCCLAFVDILDIINAFELED